MEFSVVYQRILRLKPNQIHKEYGSIKWVLIVKVDFLKKLVNIFKNF